MPTAGGLDKAVLRAKEIGCTAIQVFTSSPQMWKGRTIKKGEPEALAKALADTGIGAHIVSHDSYLVNLCATKPEIREKSYDALASELMRCATLGIPYVVSHIGATTGQELAEAQSIACDAIVRMLDETPGGAMLLMETTAGQGSSLNSSFEEIAQILERTEAPDRLGVCLDTCHIFAAGYDIRTAETYGASMERFQSLVGFDRLKVVHANDSKQPFGSRKDRHEHIGQGEIGEEGFRCLVNDPRLENTMIVVETPDAETHHAENVARLWSYVEN